MVNRSAEEVYFAEIQSAGQTYRFGYLGPHGAGKTISGCALSFNSGVTIQWEESDIVRKASVDLKAYEPKKCQVFGFWFNYIGNGHWKVIARSGRTDDSRVVVP